MPCNESAAAELKSTEAVAQLCVVWLRNHCPFVQVRLLYSRTNVVWFDGNIAFVNQKATSLVQEPEGQESEAYRGCAEGKLQDGRVKIILRFFVAYSKTFSLIPVFMSFHCYFFSISLTRV